MLLFRISVAHRRCGMGQLHCKPQLPYQDAELLGRGSQPERQLTGFEMHSYKLLTTAMAGHYPYFAHLFCSPKLPATV